MADRFKPPSIDWTTPGDIHKRFKLFQQKCELIFEGPLDKVEEAKDRRSTLKSKHPDNDLHHEANHRRQERQAVFYDRKAGSDKRPLSNQEPVFVWNTLKNIW